MNDAEFKSLLSEYLDGRLNADQAQSFLDSLQSAEHEEQWRDAIGDILNNKALHGHSDQTVMRETLATILKNNRHNELHSVPENLVSENLVSENPVSGKVSKMSFSRTWIRIAAAAILIGISFGTYFLIQNTKSRPTETADKTVAPSKKDIQNDVAPGGNKAVLTLSNGSQIILDSAHNGKLAEQGNTNIIKTDSGKLVYNAVSNTSTEKPDNNSNPSEISLNTLSTPRGGQYELTLPDGTKVWLNAASSITYPAAFNGKERKVTVTGEAYFEVVHNDRQPFVVSVNSMEVRDIGTSFNINAYPDEKSISTTLIEGSVKVIAAKKSNVQAVILIPGQQAKVSENQIKVINHPNLDQTVAWKNGLFNFQDVKLEPAMRQLSRWYDIEVLYEKNIPDIEFGGTIKQNLTLSNLLKLLEGSGVHFRIEPNKKLIVLP